MRRLLFAVLLVVLPLAAFGQPSDRDAILGADGTLFTIESAPSYDYPNANADSSRLLALTIQKQNAAPRTVFVPESLQDGSNTSPTLAYDSDSDTLFIFWERGLNNNHTSELLLTSYQNGKFSQSSIIENSDFHWCHNLRVGVTRKMQSDDDAKTMVPGLTVHAVWWDYNPHGEVARYAMLPIDKGTVDMASIIKKDLAQFFTAREMMPSGPVDPQADAEVLRHPQLTESTSHETVDIVFGDIPSASLRRLTVRVGVNGGRLRVPLGVRGGSIGAPRLKADSNSRISSIFTPGSDKMVFYTMDEDAVRYAAYSSNGGWSATRSIALNEKVTASSAVEVIRRMVWDADE